MKKKTQFQMKEPYVFWNEETQLSELHWKGFVLTGTTEATMEAMDFVNDVERYRLMTSAILREIATGVNQGLDKLASIGRKL